MCSALVSAHGLKADRSIFMCSALVSADGLKNEIYSYFTICTNGTNGECSLHLLYQSVEELTIRTNGTNRKACLTMVIFYQW